MFLRASKRPGATASGGPARVPPRYPGAPSIISADLKIVGDLNSEGDIQIDGAVEGDVRSRALTIGEGAIVHGAVFADNVRIYGALTGEIEARSVVMAKTAQVEGDIAHESLAMESGASLTGRLKRLPAARAADTAPEHGSKAERGSAAPSSPGAQAAGRYGL